MIEALLLNVILGLVVYRVARFIALDTLIEEPRDSVAHWLEGRQENVVWRKLLDLLGCPWCITIWVAAGAVGAHYLFVGGMPMPVWVWLGSATVALIVWAIVDSE